MDTTVLNLSSSLAPVVALAEVRNVVCKLFWNLRRGTYLNTMGVIAFCLGWPTGKFKNNYGRLRSRHAH